MKSRHLVILCLLAATLSGYATSVTLVSPNFGTYTARDAQGNLYTPSATAYELPEGTILTLTPTPKSDCSIFAEWVCIGGTVSDNRLQVGTEDLTLYARFQILQYLIEAEVQPTDAGTATVKCGVRDIFLSVAGAVNCGSRIRLTVAQGSNKTFRFSHWNDGDTNQQRYVDADDNHTYTAIFVSSTADDDTAAAADRRTQRRSYIEDGLLKVEYNGHIYNAQGTRIH